MFFLGIVITVAAYLIGSLSAALIVSKKFGMPDPRGYGSGNPGATNILRSGRKDAAAWTLAGDAFKGLAAVVLARCLASWLDMGPGVVAWAAVAVVVGHMWPLFYGFKGGKGVATALGVLLGMSLGVTLFVAAVWGAMALKFKKSSLASLTAAALAPWAMFVIDRANHRPSWGWALVVIALLIFYRHRGNIKRLCSGSESAIGETAAAGRTYGAQADGARTYGTPAATAAPAAAAVPAVREEPQPEVSAGEGGAETARAGAAAAEKQPESPVAAETAWEEALDASQADLRDGDALEEEVIAQAREAMQAAADERAQTQVQPQLFEPAEEGRTAPVQVETLPEHRAGASETEAAPAETAKPKRARKPRKPAGDTE